MENAVWQCSLSSLSSLTSYFGFVTFEDHVSHSCILGINCFMLTRLQINVQVFYVWEENKKMLRISSVML